MARAIRDRAGGGLHGFLLAAAAWALLASAGQKAIDPTVTPTPNPPCGGSSCDIEIGNMPSSGFWSVTVTFSSGGGPPTSTNFQNTSSGTVTVDVPPNGGRMTVLVTMGSDASRSSYAVVECE